MRSPLCDIPGQSGQAHTINAHRQPRQTAIPRLTGTHSRRLARPTSWQTTAHIGNIVGLVTVHRQRQERARLDVRLMHFRHGAASPAHERISDDGRMEWIFTGEVIEWHGPAPYLFVAMTPEESEDLKEEARGLIYWGQVPVHVTIGGTEFTTALFPKDGRYLVPLKVAVQRAEAIEEGAIVEVVLRLNATRRE